MRVFVAGLFTETNTFAPLPTGMASFARGELSRGEVSASRQQGFCGVVMRLWRQLAEEQGASVVESLAAYAEPGGRTLRGVYEELRYIIVDDLRTKGPFDIVLLILHGAMVAYGYDDCEGDLLAATRAAVGPSCVIGVVLDLHCHLTPQMMAATPILVTFKYYPHTDIAERAREVFSLAWRASLDEIRPATASFDCQMVGVYPTTNVPMSDIVIGLKKAETREHVLSVSFCHGFPWADVADVGSRMLVITNGRAELARQVAEELGREIYNLRDKLIPTILSFDEGLDLSLTMEGAVVMAETSDNAGGGAPSDSTVLLRQILDRGMSRVAVGCLWDPTAVGVCIEAGVGARFDLRLGGRDCQKFCVLSRFIND